MDVELHPRRAVKFLGGPMHGLAVPVETECPDHLVPGMAEYFLRSGERYELWVIRTLWGGSFAFVCEGYLPTELDLIPNERWFCAN